jgi:hypothetical protein
LPPSAAVLRFCSVDVKQSNCSTAERHNGSTLFNGLLGFIESTLVRGWRFASHALRLRFEATSAAVLLLIESIEFSFRNPQSALRIWIFLEPFELIGCPYSNHCLKIGIVINVPVRAIFCIGNPGGKAQPP